MAEKADTILLAPRWPKPWRSLLTMLPVAATFDLPQHPDLFTPGPYVSAAAAQGAGTHAKQYAITAYYILWHTPQPPKRKFGNGLVARQARAQQGPPSAAASSLGSPDV